MLGRLENIFDHGAVSPVQLQRSAGQIIYDGKNVAVRGKALSEVADLDEYGLGIHLLAPFNGG
jgi:hypothetical protein